MSTFNFVIPQNLGELLNYVTNQYVVEDIVVIKEIPSSLKGKLSSKQIS